MRPIALALCAGLVASPAVAQRAASPEAVASAFQDAVTGICIPAVETGKGVDALPAVAKAKVQASSDTSTRQQAGAAADETVWDVVSAKGVVVIRESAGRCVVSVHGAPVVPTILSLAQRLSDSAGYEKLVQAPPPNGFGQSLIGNGMTVQINGSEPGMPGNRSRLSVVTATVFDGRTR